MENQKHVVIVITRGPDHEKSTVLWTVAESRHNSVEELITFFNSPSQDWVRPLYSDVRSN